MAYTTGDIIQSGPPEHVNDYTTQLNLVNGTPTGPTPPTVHGLEYGYGQVDLPLKSPGDVIRTVEWTNLRNSIQNAADHQGTSISLIASSAVAAGEPVKAYDFQTALTAITTNRFNANGAGATQLQLSSTQTRSIPWNTFLFHEVAYQFTSVAHRNAFFNSGGQFRIDASLIGGSNAQSTSWATMLSNAGTVICDYQNFYPLTTSYTNIFEIFGSGGPGGGYYYYYYGYNSDFTNNRYYVDAKIDSGDPTIVWVYIGFDDQYNLPLPTDNVNGTITSAITMRKASSVYLNNPVIAYPTIAATNTNF